MTDPVPSYTDDTLFEGRLICRQHQKGYRFSIDAILLAHFCRPTKDARVLDLGTGCGIVSLIMAYRYPEIFLTALEIQADLAALARSNVVENKYDGRIEVINGDYREIKKLLPVESFDLIVSNPPYYQVGKGRMNPADEQAGARHELYGDLFQAMKNAAFVVKNRGRVCVVYPAEQTARLFSAMMTVNLIPKRLLPVYSYPGEGRARLVLVEGIKNGGDELSFQAPLYIYSRKNGPYSSQMQDYYR
ncbi:MAG: methyltransferase [Desulfobulbaceae bacterium]|nr:methyltransferase [Desulfobulbaceae bacterium]